MKCLEPVLVGYSLGRKTNGDLWFVPIQNCRPEEVDDRVYVFGKEAAPIYARCGKCPLCLKAKKRDWTTRICDEARTASAAWFVTLTYSPEHLPINNVFLREPTLVKADVQKFFKRLRKAVDGAHLRYVQVGEYGTKFGRPHYHFILFGLPDLPLVFHECRGKYDVFRSPLIERCWPFGFSTVTRFDYSNARYVAQYCQKKAKLQDLSPYVAKPFLTGSRGKGGEGAVGAPWFDKYHSEILRDGFCLLNVRGSIFKVSIPQYYLRRARERYRDEWLALVLRRAEYLTSHVEELPTTAQFAERMAELASEARSVEIHEQEAIKKRRYEND